jgi:nitrile hydratase accessory protein
LSSPDIVSDRVRLAAAGDQGTPVFAEPWQAQAFALAVTLSDQGHFTWKEWATELATTLKAASDRGEPDDGSRYYDHWLATLERLVIAKGLADEGALDARKDAWVGAYRNTPHGLPIELRSHSAASARWLLVGVACLAVAYWLGQSGVVTIGLLTSAGFGSLLGIRHALEPDHLAAVSTLMTGERSSAKAAWLGACWGLGHTLTLMVAGVLMVLLRADMPTFASELFEFCVVALLVGFGVRAMYQGASGRVARRTHSHVKGGTPSSAAESHWRFARRPLIVGAAHGLAGSGAITALVVTTLPSTVTRISYLALFGIGTTVGMSLLSGLLGWPLARFGADRRTARTLSLAIGGFSIALGLLWTVRLLSEFFSS